MNLEQFKGLLYTISKSGVLVHLTLILCQIMGDGVLALAKEATTCTSASQSSSSRGMGYELAVVPYDETHLLNFHHTNRSFRIGQHSISIQQNWRDGGVAAVVWDAAVVLGEYLSENTGAVAGKQVIELGAGTGLAGIVAALHGAHLVDITDQEAALSSLRENINLNLPPVKQLGSSKIRVRELTWGQNLHRFSESYDVILGADIVYIEDTFPDLINTLEHLSTQQSVILLSCRIRYERDESFLSLLREKFTVEKVHYDKPRDIYIFKAHRQT